MRTLAAAFAVVALLATPAAAQVWTPYWFGPAAPPAAYNQFEPGYMNRFTYDPDPQVQLQERRESTLPGGYNSI